MEVPVDSEDVDYTGVTGTMLWYMYREKQRVS